MQVLALACLALAAARSSDAARRVPRQFDYFTSHGDFVPQYSIHPVAFAQEPYPYNVRPRSEPFTGAVCKLIPSAGQQVGGDIVLQQTDPAGPVEVSGTIFGLTPGLHGFHVHQNGNTTNNCKGAGGHFNPGNKKHGAPSDAVRHAGDLGNIVADGHGFANFHIVDGEISLVDENPRQVMGRAIVVHAKEDDLGKGSDAESLKTGNAGSRVACCVIHKMSEYHSN